MNKSKIVFHARIRQKGNGRLVFEVPKALQLMVVELGETCKVTLEAQGGGHNA